MRKWDVWLCSWTCQRPDYEFSLVCHCRANCVTSVELMKRTWIRTRHLVGWGRYPPVLGLFEPLGVIMGGLCCASTLRSIISGFDPPWACNPLQISSIMMLTSGCQRASVWTSAKAMGVTGLCVEHIASSHLIQRDLKCCESLLTASLFSSSTLSNFAADEVIELHGFSYCHITRVVDVKFLNRII